MNPIIKKLKMDHQRFAHLIKHMEWTMERCRHGEGVDMETLEQFVGYCSEHADHYHHPLEDYLFLRMLVRDPSIRPIIDRMTDEHERLHTATRQLNTMLKAASSQDFVSRSQFLDALETYLALYYQHMQIEETELFSRMGTALTEEDWLAAEAWLADKPPSPFDDPQSHEYQRIESLLTQ